MITGHWVVGEVVPATAAVGGGAGPADAPVGSDAAPWAPPASRGRRAKTNSAADAFVQELSAQKMAVPISLHLLRTPSSQSLFAVPLLVPAFPPRCALSAFCGFTAGSEILVGGGWDVSRTQSHRWFRKPWCGWVQLKSQRWPMTFAEPGTDPVHKVPY